MQHRYLLCLALLSACTPGTDLHGIDPGEYYAKHPITNTLEQREIIAKAYFAPTQSRLAPTEIADLRTTLSQASPPAAKGIVVTSPGTAPIDTARQEHVRRLIKSFGYTTPIALETSYEQESGTIGVKLDYLAVIAPDCPDWKMSPVTTYSNTTHTNFGCAATVNLGLMVADPHDLVYGKGEATSRTERAAKALTDYRTNAVGSSAASAPAAAAGAATTGN